MEEVEDIVLLGRMRDVLISNARRQVKLYISHDYNTEKVKDSDPGT